MLAREIAGYLAAALGGSVGTEWQIGEIPTDTADCVMLFNAPSPEPDKESVIEEQRIDFWIRYKNSKTGYDRARAIYDALHRNNNWTLGTTHYIYEIDAAGQIDDMDRDLQNRKIWRLGINFVYRRLELVS